MCHLHSCQSTSSTTRAAPLQSDPCSGPHMFCWTRALLYMGSYRTLFCTFSFSFCLRLLPSTLRLPIIRWPSLSNVATPCCPALAVAHIETSRVLVYNPPRLAPARRGNQIPLCPLFLFACSTASLTLVATSFSVFSFFCERGLGLIFFLYPSVTNSRNPTIHSSLLQNLRGSQLPNTPVLTQRAI